MRKLVFIAAALGLLVSCLAEVEPPTEQSPTLPIATGIPAPTEVSNQAAATGESETVTSPTATTVRPANLFQEAGELFRTFQPPETDPKPLYDALAQEASAYLFAAADPDISLVGQAAISDLTEELGKIPNLPLDAVPQVKVIHLGDDQGGSADLVLLMFERVMGLPIVGIKRFGSDYTPLPIETFLPLASGEERYYFPVRLETREMTGEGVEDVLYVYELPGASSLTQQVGVLRWAAGAEELIPIFRAALITWAGEASFELEPEGAAMAIRISYPWFGAFDHKLLEHPTATQLWEYDQGRGRYVKADESVSPPQTRRQQLNAAEALFRNGEWARAVQEYERAWADPNLEDEDFGDSKADPAAFAVFRQAMTLALLGRDAEAAKLLARAQNSGEALKTLASRYAANLNGEDAPLRAWSAIVNAGELFALIYESRAGNLDFPFEAGEVYFEGGIAAAFLNRHPGVEAEPSRVVDSLEELGFRYDDHLAADLDADGFPEFLFVTTQGRQTPNQSQVLWFVYRRGDTWRARAIQRAESLDLPDVSVGLPSQQKRGVVVGLPESYTPDQLALAWDGTRVIYLDPLTLEPLEEVPGVTVGAGPQEDDF